MIAIAATPESTILTEQQQARMAYYQPLVDVLATRDWNDRRNWIYEVADLLKPIDPLADASVLVTWKEKEELVWQIITLHAEKGRNLVFTAGPPEFHPDQAWLFDVMGYHEMRFQTLLPEKALGDKYQFSDQAIAWIKVFVMHECFEKEFDCDCLQHLFEVFAFFLPDLVEVFNLNGSSTAYSPWVFRVIRVGIDSSDETLFPWHYRLKMS